MKTRRMTLLLFRQMFFVVLSMGLIVGLWACGGGGGGGGGSSSSSGGSGISYSGSTSQAAVTDANAVEISTSAYQSGSTGTTLGTLGAVQTEDRQIGRSRSLILSQTLKHTLLLVDHSKGIGLDTIFTDTGTIYGDCSVNPGSATYSESYDDVTGDFTGAINFNSYCSEGVAISGSVSYSGNIDIDTEEIQRLSISFNSLIATSGSDSFTASGNISFNFSVTPVTATLNLLLHDSSTSKVCKIENLIMTLTEGVNYVDVNIVSGRFYHPDYGYLGVSTLSPWRIYDGDDWPSQGVLVCTGKTGIGGDGTKAKLTALSVTQYKVEADTDGDRAYDDFNSGTMNWSDL